MSQAFATWTRASGFERVESARALDVDEASAAGLRDVAAIGRIEAINTLLEVVCQSTGMGFAAVARVTEDHWIACRIRDELGFGLEPGAERPIETTLCRQVRDTGVGLFIDDVAQDPIYRDHPLPAQHGFRSHASVPIVLADGTFFGTLCAVDPKPAHVSTPAIRGLFSLCAMFIASHLNAQTAQSANEDMRRSDALTRSILAATPDCVKVLSKDGILEFMNERGVELNQLDSDAQVIGQEFARLWPDMEQAKIRSAIQIASTGLSARVEGFCPTAKGEPRWWEASFAPFRPVGADSVKIVGVSRDITERVRNETALRRSAEALRELNDTLEQRVEERTRDLQRTEDALRQSQKMEAVGQLTGGLAHDFNNLLTGIIGSLELVQTRVSQGRVADVERYINAAQSAAQRAAALTHRLLAFSRRQTLDPKPTATNALIRDMEELIRRTVGPEIIVDVVTAEDLWDTLVDPNQLENALLNLCINARDAMPQGGHLRIRTAMASFDDTMARERDLPAGEYVHLSVRDSGAGMSPEIIARAFDPFFTTKPTGMGTGLGLSMIHGFARQSGGQVRIQSEVGKGTSVCLYLPRHLIAPPALDEQPGSSSAAPARRKETVLVVDDEPMVRMLVTDVLHDLGYAAIEAVDGSTGLKALQSNDRLDLLITDVGLPGELNGRQVADAARILRPELQVLFITGFAETTVLSHGQLPAGMHLLTKPFALDTLAGRITSILASQQSENLSHPAANPSHPAAWGGQPAAS